MSGIVLFFMVMLLDFSVFDAIHLLETALAQDASGTETKFCHRGIAPGPPGSVLFGLSDTRYMPLFFLSRCLLICHFWALRSDSYEGT